MAGVRNCEAEATLTYFILNANAMYSKILENFKLCLEHIFLGK